jgi:hypothetical protein
VKKARLPNGHKIQVQITEKNLTSQAGLIPVVKFLRKMNVISLIKETVTMPKRGSNASYDYADVIFVTIVGMIGGATSLTSVVAVWADAILRKIAGWIKIPCDSHFGRLLKDFKFQNVVELETLNHILRGKISKLLSRSGLDKTRFFKKSNS